MSALARQPLFFFFTCVREVTQGAAEGAPLQTLDDGVAVVQAPSAQVAVARVLLESGALGHDGPHHALLLLQLRWEKTHTYIVNSDADKQAFPFQPTVGGEKKPPNAYILSGTSPSLGLQRSILANRR